MAAAYLACNAVLATEGTRAVATNTPPASLWSLILVQMVLTTIKECVALRV